LHFLHTGLKAGYFEERKIADSLGGGMPTNKQLDMLVHAKDRGHFLWKLNDERTSFVKMGGQPKFACFADALIITTFGGLPLEILNSNKEFRDTNNNIVIRAEPLIELHKKEIERGMQGVFLQPIGQNGEDRLLEGKTGRLLSGMRFEYSVSIFIKPLKIEEHDGMYGYIEIVVRGAKVRYQLVHAPGQSGIMDKKTGLPLLEQLGVSKMHDATALEVDRNKTRCIAFPPDVSKGAHIWPIARSSGSLCLPDVICCNVPFGEKLDVVLSFDHLPPVKALSALLDKSTNLPVLNKLY